MALFGLLQETEEHMTCRKRQEGAIPQMVVYATADYFEQHQLHFVL